MKSQVKDLTDLAVCIYKDATAKCTANQLEDRDIKTLMSRAEHEGLSFYTITLPSLGKDLETCLSLGRVGSTCFRSFRKHGKTPAFLRGFFTQIFCKATGDILDEPEISAIEGIRQIAYSFKKVLLDCTAKRTAQAMGQFAECEADLSVPLVPYDTELFNSVSDRLWPPIIGAYSNNCIDMGRPKHGPGATAEMVSGNSKYLNWQWYDRLEPYFPMLHNAFSSESVIESEEFEKVTIVCKHDEKPVRVIAVPKTLKGPRVIAIEPVCMQYTQQALAGVLVKALESHKLTRGHVNFSDQSVNRGLAVLASRSEEWATLDLSSASDRVPNSLASYMFESNPEIQGAIQACRSTSAQMPDGSLLELKKFASMGSALCFPVGAMYYYTVCVIGMLESRKLPVDERSIQKVCKLIYVYGDDIIIPVRDAESVMSHLQKYYCKVNVAKSFWTGKFRESCGMDAYNGEEVIPTYIRHMPPNDRRESNALIGWVDASNSFYKKGYWLTSSHMLNRCERYLGNLPIVGPQCAGLGKVSFQPFVSSKRWNKDIQVVEVKTWCAVPVYQIDRLEGYGALTKCLLRLEAGDEPGNVHDEHLSETARHGAVTLKRRWTRPY